MVLILSTKLRCAAMLPGAGPAGEVDAAPGRGVNGGGEPVGRSPVADADEEEEEVAPADPAAGGGDGEARPVADEERAGGAF
jgi:hypothetical protein